jgi:uncharacterized membrane protein YkoI
MGRLIACLTLAVALLAPGFAAAGEGHDKAKRLKDAGEILPLASVIKMATTKKPGRVIEAELKSSRGGYVYEIELVDKSGIVWELKYDAKTGELISTKEED